VDRTVYFPLLLNGMQLFSTLVFQCVRARTYSNLAS